MGELPAGQGFHFDFFETEALAMVSFLKVGDPLSQAAIADRQEAKSSDNQKDSL